MQRQRQRQKRDSKIISWSKRALRYSGWSARIWGDVWQGVGTVGLSKEIPCLWQGQLNSLVNGVADRLRQRRQSFRSKGHTNSSFSIICNICFSVTPSLRHSVTLSLCLSVSLTRNSVLSLGGLLISGGQTIYVFSGVGKVTFGVGGAA